uniref:Uncharacterized protein n=1 Tax=Chromera velia CCMP2878 TaxID=1169474 RepID=A0A0G4F924_9ALVE|eukprot:Cvel_15795.t1-p1 / transcript=Cvel_15795.t1 / gene=Cvel_15795 / organism=Chromera_velia_CCMP2878 / gene_product=hypothetical protein / transcript_product=hypothetical protein / location=Cvel_scaffold1185:42344-43162(+) / protein_length=273 / sequence_SO=supercontig / SO=protein_coding / is_pseudo=false
MFRTVFCVAVSVGAPGVLGSEVFSDPALFERLSHFKDVGVPDTKEDPVNKAMIADGTCRLLDVAKGDETAFSFWYSPESTKEVIDALAALPSTEKPSNFTLSAKKSLAPVCKRTQKQEVAEKDYSCRKGYDFRVIKESMFNWHRAVCAGPSESSWKGEFDPAYQPQQIAMGAGFLCIVACDCGGWDFPVSSLQSFAASLASAEETKTKICDELPWGLVDFSAVSSPDTLAAVAFPILHMCGCGRCADCGDENRGRVEGRPGLRGGMREEALIS